MFIKSIDEAIELKREVFVIKWVLIIDKSDKENYEATFGINLRECEHVVKVEKKHNDKNEQKTLPMTAPPISVIIRGRR